MVGPGVLIGGSVNTFKTLAESVFVRPGLKRRGVADADNAGVTSSYEWETSYGALRVLRVIEDLSTGLSKLQVESNLQDGQTYLWYDLMTDQTSGRFVFDTVWVKTLLRDELIFVRGGPDLCYWGGGVGSIDTSTVDTLTLHQDVQFAGFLQGGGTLIINGNTYTYTGAAYIPNIIYTHADTNEVMTFGTGGAGFGNYMSQMITTGPNSTGIVLVDILVNFLSDYPIPIVFTCYVCEDNAGVPGAILATSTVGTASVGSPGTSPFHFIVNMVSTPSTNYHLVFTTNANSNFIQLYTGNTPAVGTAYSADFIVWTPHDGYLYATVTENIGTSFELTGVSPDPTGEPANSVVVAVPVISANTPNQDNSNDFLKTINNQVHVGSYLSQQIYISSETNFLNFTVPLPRRAGEPDIIVIDSLARGITVQKGASDISGNAVVAGGLGDWYTIVRAVSTNLFEQSNGSVSILRTEDVNVVRTQTADLSTALAHEFIDQIGNNIVYLDQNNQLREFGIVRNVTNPVLPLLSLDLYTELKGRDFTGGALRVVSHEGDTTIYLTAPNEGIDYMYQVRNQIDKVGNAVAERLWQPPQIRGLSRIAVIEGVEYGHSATHPQLYQLWNTDQYYDDGDEDGDQLPYACHAVFSYMSLGKTLQMNFDKEYFEGYMSRGSEVYASTYMEYQGAKGIQVSTINKPIDPGKKFAKFYGATDCPVPGESILGNIEIGDGILPPSTGNTPLPKFRAIRRVKSKDVFEAAIDVWSESVDSNWGLLLVGANLQPAKRQPTGIMGILGD